MDDDDDGEAVCDSDDINDEVSYDSNDINDEVSYDSNDINDEVSYDSNDINDEVSYDSNDINDETGCNPDDIDDEVGCDSDDEVGCDSDDEVGCDSDDEVGCDSDDFDADDYSNSDDNNAEDYEDFYDSEIGNFETRLADIRTNDAARLALNSILRDLIMLNSSADVISDSLLMYLTAPSLIQKEPNTEKYCITLDPTSNESENIALPNLTIYVGNLPFNTTSKCLKNWFLEQGYRVNDIHMKKNQKDACYAFVRFESIQTAWQVLYSKQKTFVFKGQQLRINPSHKKPYQQPKNTLITTITSDNISKIIKLKITDIHYGTLISGTSMGNIQTQNSTIHNNSKYGIIANRPLADKHTSAHLNIDEDKKKIAITCDFQLYSMGSCQSSTTLKFEWDFRDLTARKISPVLINQGEVFLLIELKRPPVILLTHTISRMLGEESDEKRLPGWGPIGYANTWLFKVSINDQHDEYVKLFEILHRCNLSSRQFSQNDIINLTERMEDAQNNLESIPLIFNDDWVKENQAKVDDFFKLRWSPYPFETKFEIMKLISKRMITVYDLIIDQQAENILKLCSINTLIALTDEIAEIAPRLFATICDNEDEDSHNDDEHGRSKLELKKTQIRFTIKKPSTDDPFISEHIRSCTTGERINDTDADIASLKTVMKKPSLPSKGCHTGIFGRLLNFALKKLLKTSELCQTNATKIYVTTRELRTVNDKPFVMRKIYITPSTILYEGPYHEEKCAVTRQFVQHQDRFLRVTFRDEDYRVLHNYNDNMAKIYNSIKTILINGLNVCDRHYQFLAFSSSQLREHSCWMFAGADDGTSADSIRKWMGDFRNVRPVAKLAARLGQLFSKSLEGIQLENNRRGETPDFKQEGKLGENSREYCFTDGIGIISATFAETLSRKLKLTQKVGPCAFQIRCGGYKGMVCLDIANRITDSDVYVYFRESMKKFDANSFPIDVVRTSLSPSVAYLNRQIILLLSSLGIPDNVFVSLQDKMLQQLKALTGNSYEALGAIKELNEFGGNGCHAFLIAYLKSLGEQKDPFARQLLFALKALLVKELRTKAKIRVPDSWSLLGVIDETKTLKYGEVFIQIDNSHHRQGDPQNQILQGPVVVTRNPCFHPGDIRKLTAVDIPALHKLKNVIVFPMNGPRPHPMEMSGGDLDGDTFWISCNPKLIFSKNEEPFDYQDQEDQANNETQSQTTVQYTIKDVCNFFGEYIAADNVAVDFAKKGINAPRLTSELRPLKYPHYMEKKDKESYQSTTVLGIIYDKVASYQSNLYINSEEEIKATSSFPYQSFTVNGSDKYMKDARIVKGEYDRDLKRLMRQYGIRNEAEVVSGYILQFTSRQYANETKNLYDLKNDIVHAYRVIQEKYLHLFWEEFYQVTDESQDEQVKWSEVSKQLTWKGQIDVLTFNDKESVLEEAKKKASAWFRVTYQTWIIQINKYRKSQKNKPNTLTNNQQTEEPKDFKELFSFAWIVYPVLLEIYDETRSNAESNPKRKRQTKKKNNRKDISAVPKNNSYKRKK
ncbi:unnamed protein product [Rotaria magnacalcarata]|uniref:RNA-directed RNA polymerase n=3 Tax=Rotaria magnacalcarata TaxID=392030 RepID=A0A816GS10_9BILA|nr:unnamed protein product [Rotaria magnacalcarata]